MRLCKIIKMVPPGEYTITIKQIGHNYESLYRYNLFNVNRLYVHVIPVFIFKSVKTGRIKMRPDFTELKFVAFEALSELTQWTIAKPIHDHKMLFMTI